MGSILLFINRWFENISTIASLVLSIIAVWATLYTVKKQNITSLFEKRLEVFRLLNFISHYAQIIASNTNAEPGDSVMQIDLKTASSNEYLDWNAILLSVWVNQRLIYSKKHTDDNRLRLMYRAMNGKTDQELINVMEPYFLYDLHTLRQGTYIFKGSLAAVIEETANYYESFIDNLLALPRGNGAHSVEKAKHYFDNFVKVGLKWSKDARIRKALNKDMRII